MIEGHIETVLPEGIVVGWVRDTGDSQPCHLRLGQGGAILAEALASVFRPDLLRTGHGHGHHGFRARLAAPLPPGPCSLAVSLPRQGQTVAMGVVVPDLRPARPCRVERLLRPTHTWTVADLLRHPACIPLDANLRVMGLPRFVDCLFHFALSRWPSAAEAAVHARDLERGRIAPKGLMVELLSSRERADLPPALAAPFAPEFPFHFS